MDTRLRTPLLLISLVLLTSGCATFLPAKFSTAKEAFPDVQSMIPPKDRAAVTATFPAPYEDVYRAVLISTSQAMFNVAEESKRNGYVLAESIEQISKTHYYFAIRIEELGGKSSRVTVAAKTQSRCESAMGVWLGAALPGYPCPQAAEVHWAISGDYRADPDPQVQKLMNFVRNNLIAAGLL